MNEEYKREYRKQGRLSSQLARAIKKHESNIEYERQEIKVQDKVNTLEFYNTLSEAEKRVFDEKLKIKEIRDNYLLYLKYVHGEDYKITHFHALLGKLAQKVVEKVEKGEKVRLLISCPPQHGKGYPVDFPVLTTKGWKKHGDLQVGDYVFNDNGEQVAVLGNQEHYLHDCLEVTFANGEKHIVTREHLWKVYLEKEDRTSGKHRRIRYETILETQEIMENLSKYRRSPYVLINKPLKNDEKELPIDPYVLGLWLGDGESKRNISIVDDKDLADELNAIGDRENYIVYKDSRTPKLSYIKYGKEVGRPKKKCYKYDFTKKLHELGLYDNKHIPTIYLLGSEEQRWQLLRGLMDTDGCCDTRGNCEFCNTNKELAYNTYTLLHSLGIKARINEYDATLYGRFISKKYRVLFTANHDDHIFNIKRKQDRVSKKILKDREDKYKYFIKSIREVGRTIVSCVNVEGGMYLAGKELIPTHNSNLLTETLPSWFMGRNPDSRCIVTAYNADIAEKFGDRNRQKVKDFGKNIFNIEVSDSQDNKTQWDIKGHNGGLYATGLNGSLTSNNGALIIVDDPIKNEVEANNPSIREQIWANFSTSLMTRQQGKGNAIIVIQTRWHEDDLIGRILNSEIKDEWLYINIPCVWESGIDKLLHRKIGETLCPQLGFDSKWAESMKKMLGARRWNALYQGVPFVEGGDIVKRDFLKFYTKANMPTVFEEVTMSCDLSFGGIKKQDDPCGIAIWGRLGGNHYLIDFYIKKMTFTETLERIRYFCGKYPTMRSKIIEAKANGNATIETLNSEIGGFIPYDPKGLSKESRLQLCLPYLESGNVWFPDESVNKDIEEQVQILLRFPKVAHDEIVDITTQYLLNYQYRYGGKINTEGYYADLSLAFRGIKI